jgi:LAO/AO transport system kinase
MQDLQKLISGLRSGDRLSLSKCITLAESEAFAHQDLKDELIREIEKEEYRTFRLAVTGLPGSGKSTLIDSLGMHWVERGHKVAVLAVDPSSSFSMGSVLGDKTRMTRLASSENAFIRPSPSRLKLGGIAAHTYETILLCEAAGFDRIIIETVGVGQSETMASLLSDACLLVLVAGTGDDIQGVKKGILETADFVFVNKADGPMEKQAKAYALELQSISSLWPLRRNGKHAGVMWGSAGENIQIDELLSAAEAFFSEVSRNGQWHRHRRVQHKEWFQSLWKEWIFSHLQTSGWFVEMQKEAERDLEKGESISSLLLGMKRKVKDRF